MKPQYLLLPALLFLASCNSSVEIEGDPVNNDLLLATIAEDVQNATGLVSISSESSGLMDESILYGEATRGVTKTEMHQSQEITSYEGDVFVSTDETEAKYKVDNQDLSLKQETTITEALQSDSSQQGNDVIISKKESKYSSDPYSSITYSMSPATSYIDADKYMLRYAEEVLPSISNSSLAKDGSTYFLFSTNSTSSTRNNPLFPNDNTKDIGLTKVTNMRADFEYVDGHFRFKEIRQEALTYAKVDYYGEPLKDSVINRATMSMSFHYGTRKQYNGTKPTLEDYQDKGNYTPNLTDDSNNTYYSTDYSEGYQAMTGEEKYLYRFSIVADTTYKLCLGVENETVVTPVVYSGEPLSLSTETISGDTYFTVTSTDTDAAATSIYLDVIVDKESHQAEATIHRAQTSIFDFPI